VKVVKKENRLSKLPPGCFRRAQNYQPILGIGHSVPGTRLPPALALRTGNCALCTGTLTRAACTQGAVGRCSTSVHVSVKEEPPRESAARMAEVAGGAAKIANSSAGCCEKSWGHTNFQMGVGISDATNFRTGYDGNLMRANIQKGCWGIFCICRTLLAFSLDRICQ